MFQYAFGLALEQHGARVEYDLSWFDGIRDLQVTSRQFELERTFKLAIPVADPKLVMRWSDFSTCLYRRAWRRLAGRKKTHICEHDFGGFGYHPEIWMLHSGYLDGYWQSISYLKGTEDDIRRQFEFREFTDARNRQYLDAIRSTESVAIHVRRGDFLFNADVHPPLSSAYYLSAINILKQRIFRPAFFVFSDDIPWARQNLSCIDAVFVQGNEGADSCHDMNLMSRCRHLICANSSFSWWAAWLNPLPNRQVFIPADYAQPGKRMVDGWIRLETGKSD